MNDTPRILIVDDEAYGREILEDMLITQGYTLFFAGDGPEALAKVAETAPDVILLDVMMPGMDGFEVCQRLKNSEQWRHIPIILVTALNRKEYVVNGLDAGADDFLHKPVVAPELRARVRSMLRIKQQHDALAATNEKLEAMLRLREDLSGMIVHDMRSPLSVILGYSEMLLKREMVAPKGIPRLEKVINQAQHLNAFLDDLLMLAKMEQGCLQPDLGPVDLGNLCRVVHENQGIIAKSKKIDFLIDLPENSPSLLLDAHLMQRVVDNLVSNAIKFTSARGKVVLRLESPAGDLTRIQVLDEGRGVAAEDRERIFDKFEVASLKQEGISQTGLGLAFCRQAVEAHNGHITVEANQPKGSVFTVELKSTIVAEETL